jgi:hypothetical protein
MLPQKTVMLELGTPVVFKNRIFSNHRFFSFKIGYDFRNKSLKVANHQPSNVMQKSMYEQSMIGSFFKFKEEDKIEGPFAQSKIFYENSKVDISDAQRDNDKRV